MTKGSNKNNPANVLTLERTTYSQFLRQILFLNFSQDVMMRMSFDLPCSLCPVEEVLMLTGNSVIWHFKNSLILHNCDGVTVTLTSCCSGGILNRRCTVLNWRSCSSFWIRSMIASSLLFAWFFGWSSSCLMLLISSESSVSSTVRYSTSLMLTVQTFSPLNSCQMWEFALYLTFTETRLTTVPLPLGGFSSIFFIGHDAD
jgi:hypothetical protein